MVTVNRVKPKAITETMSNTLSNVTLHISQYVSIYLSIADNNNYQQEQVYFKDLLQCRTH